MMSKRALNARARKRGSRPVAHRPAASRPVAQRSGVQRPGAPHPKRPATRTAGSPALVPSPLVLPAECTLADAESLKLKLAALLQDVSPVTLDVSGVRRIDTASLQLLAAFARDRRARPSSRGERRVPGVRRRDAAAGPRSPDRRRRRLAGRLPPGSRGRATGLRGRTMALDLTQFHDAFFEESFEALDSMEAALLKLDVGAPDPEIINTIFRVAHSIKGGSATFGFSDIASFTHSLETLLDELRGRRMVVSVAISDLLLKSVDVMRDMLRAVQGKLPIDAQRVADLQFDLELAIARKDGGAATFRDTAPAGAARLWRIHFRPYPQFFARGNDPLRMLRELATLGEVEITAEAADLPPLVELDPQACYLAWTIELEGDADEEGIREVFDWATGECDLGIECVGACAGADARARRDAIAPAPPSSEPPLPSAAAQDTSAIEASRNAPAAAASSDAPASDAPVAAAVAHAPMPLADVVPLDPPKAPAAKPETPHLSGIGDSGSIRVSVEKIDELMNTVGELVITQAMLSQLSRSLEGPAADQFRSGLAQLERNMRELQESVMRVRMLPISFVFSRFPRMVRDLAQRLGKQIELKLTGEQTELDKTVLEKIGDPLVHLVRNSIDHGIEKPEVRAAAGKPPAGTVHLDACHRGGNIAVEVSDDGGGLDKDRILAKARERGLVGPSDQLTDEQIYELIFLPGFSTAEQTTDLSG